MKYYQIDENIARTAHYMVHMGEYKQNSATDSYRAAVDEAAVLVEKQKSKVSPYYHEKLDSLLDCYARRLSELDKLEAARVAPIDSTKFDGGEIVKNAELNRLQIVFDEIPGEEIRDELKRNGFRWSPSNQAWQRQLTPNAEAAARRIFCID